MATDVIRAPAGRFDEEGDWIVRQTFSEADLAQSPEEYAARHAHLWGCFSYHQYRYRDAALGAWVRRLHEILYSAGEVERCRQRFLTPQEIADMHRRDAEPF